MVRLALLLPLFLLAQGTTGFVEGAAAPGTAIVITGGAGFQTEITADSDGRFAIALPYGRYEVSVSGAPGVSVVVHAGETARVGVAAAPEPSYPEAFSLLGALLSREPVTVTEPLDFAGLSDNRLAVASRGGISWTRTRHTLNGTDVTDVYQPGRPAMLPDVDAIEYAGTDVYLREPRESWHGALSTANTGAFLAWTNLPPPAERGLVQQSERFTSFTRDRVEAGGPLGRFADLIASAAGQWSAQTVPLAAPGGEQHSRLLHGDARGRIRAGSRDQIEAAYSGSSINLSDWGEPAGIEALAGGRMMPQFPLPGGFAGLSERDRFNFAQAAWTHQLSRGVVQARYGYSGAQLDTSGTGGPTSIELFGSTVTGAPPLANLATRTRHGIEGLIALAADRHQFAAGGGWQTSTARNQFTTPSSTLITAAGAPAFVVDFGTPADTRERVRSFSGFVTDQWRVTSSLSIDAALLGDISRGGVIAWNTVSPRAGFAVQVPHARGLTLRGSFSRAYAPLAARYLDFGDPNSLGGSLHMYQGPLVARFGGSYASIDPALRRPYADQFDVGAEIAPVPNLSASIRLFRRDEKQRLAAVNVGVPAQAFTPVTVVDPGSDGTAGTSDDQRLTVFEQNPATFGQDRYLLTNPPGLREQQTGLVATLANQWRRLSWHLSFVAEKSWGPTNPGDSVFENDPGVAGSLFADPNTMIHAPGHSFLDRAFVAKLRLSYRLPAGIELATVADYLDGLPFGRQLLVTGMSQGPIVVAATIRGSPEGGSRSEYVANWNLRVRREFPLPKGRLSAAVDVLNVLNAAQRLQESDLSGAAFNLRLPVAIQPPRFARLELRYEF